MSNNDNNKMNDYRKAADAFLKIYGFDKYLSPEMQKAMAESGIAATKITAEMMTNPQFAASFAKVLQSIDGMNEASREWAKVMQSEAGQQMMKANAELSRQWAESLRMGNEFAQNISDFWRQKTKEKKDDDKEKSR